MDNTKEISKRQYWVDIAKSFAIIAVVVGHIGFNWPVGALFPTSDLLIFLWHVPVFFLLGGFFLKEDRLLKPVKFICGKVKSLYLLILYIYIPVLLLHNLFIRIGFYDLTIDYYGKYVTHWGLVEFGKHLLAAVFCAGREPLLGAIWFVYVLFMALCIVSIVSWILKNIGPNWNEKTYEIIRGLVFLTMAVFSCTMTQKIHITIPRFSNTLSAVWLIYVGMMIVQKYKFKFDNFFVVIICALIAWHSAVFRGRLSENPNLG